MLLELIIIINVFLKHKILSRETILSAVQLVLLVYTQRFCFPVDLKCQQSLLYFFYSDTKIPSFNNTLTIMATEQAERPLTLTMISSYFYCTNLDQFTSRGPIHLPWTNSPPVDQFTFRGPQMCLSFQSQMTHLPTKHQPAWSLNKS